MGERCLLAGQVDRLNSQQGKLKWKYQGETTAESIPNPDYKVIKGFYSNMLPILCLNRELSKRFLGLWRMLTFLMLVIELCMVGRCSRKQLLWMKRILPS